MDNRFDFPSGSQTDGQNKYCMSPSSGREGGMHNTVNIKAHILSSAEQDEVYNKGP